MAIEGLEDLCTCPVDSEIQVMVKVSNNLAIAFLTMAPDFEGQTVSLIGPNGCACTKIQVLEAINNNLAEFGRVYGDAGLGYIGNVTSLIGSDGCGCTEAQILWAINSDLVEFGRVYSDDLLTPIGNLEEICTCPLDSPLQTLVKISNNLSIIFASLATDYVGQRVSLIGRDGCGCTAMQIWQAINGNIVDFGFFFSDGPVHGDSILMESGDYILTETGGTILLE